MQQSVRVCVAVAVTSLLMACGEVGKVPADAPLGPVMVTVLTTAGDGLPDQTAKVLFQDPDGNVVSDSMVDPMGRAQAMLPRGGSVSAIRITADATMLTASITTTLDVKPGDDLTFGLKANATITTGGGQTSMTATFTPTTGATNYKFYTPCGVNVTAGSPVTLNFHDSCHGAMFDLLGTTSVGGGMLQYLLVTGITYQGGVTFAVPTQFLPMGTFTVNMANVPDVITNMSVTRTTLLNNTPAFTLNIPLGDPGVGNVAAMVPFPPGVGNRSELSITLHRDDAAQIDQRFEAHTAGLGTSASVDLGQQKLPWFKDLAQTATGATWTMVAPGDPPDGMMVTWSGSWNDGTRPVTVSWAIAQPAQMAGVTLPRLPAAYAMIDPGQQTVAVQPASVSLGVVDYDTVTGYDQFRQMPETLLTSNIGNMGAFVGMPFQRRIMTKSVP